MKSVSKQFPYAKHNLKTNTKDNLGQRTSLKFLLQIICAILPKYRALLSNRALLWVHASCCLGLWCDQSHCVAHTILMCIAL